MASTGRTGGSGVSRLRLDPATMTMSGAIALTGVVAAIALRDVVDGLVAIAFTGVIAIAAVLVPLVSGAFVGADSGGSDEERDTAARSWVARNPDVVVSTLGIVVVALLAATVADRSASGRSIPSAAFDGVRSGWSALFTSPVPVAGDARTLVPIAVVVWIACATSTLLVRRRGNALMILLAPLMLVGFSTLVAGSHQYHPTATGCAFVACGAVVLAGSTRRPPPVTSTHERASGPTDLGRAAAGRTAAGRTALARRWTPSSARLAPGPLAIGAAAVLVAALLGGPLTFGRDDAPFDTRERFDPPTTPETAANPLDLVSVWTRRPDRVMFVVHAPQPVRTRLVALQDYDGARWTTSARYANTGTTIPATVRSGVDSQPIDVDVDIATLDGPWLPVVGDPTSIDGEAALVDRAGGSLIARDGSVTAALYRVGGTLDVADLAALQASSVAPDSQAARTVPAGLPPALQEMADASMVGATSPFAQAVLLERYLRLNYRVDPELVSGQSYGQLVDQLGRTGTGTPEQFATAFALLGRVAGLPTRVVVGFGPGTETAAGDYEVRAGDVTVWPEVDFDGAGWIAFDPVPAPDGASGGDNSALGGGGQEVVVREVDQAMPDGSDAPGAGGDATTAAGAHDASWWSRGVLGVAGLALLAGIGATGIVALKRRSTTARRRAHDPAAKVVGAWHDVLDRLGEVGVAHADHLTVQQVVEHDAATATTLAGLYRPVNRILYAPDGWRSVTDQDAELAWRARDRYVRRLRDHTTVRVRLRRRLDVRCLRRQRRRSSDSPSFPMPANHRSRS